MHVHTGVPGLGAGVGQVWILHDVVTGRAQGSLPPFKMHQDTVKSILSIWFSGTLRSAFCEQQLFKLLFVLSEKLLFQCT